MNLNLSHIINHTWVFFAMLVELMQHILIEKSNRHFSVKFKIRLYSIKFNLCMRTVDYDIQPHTIEFNMRLSLIKFNMWPPLVVFSKLSIVVEFIFLGGIFFIFNENSNFLAWINSIEIRHNDSVKNRKSHLLSRIYEVEYM